MGFLPAKDGGRGPSKASTITYMRIIRKSNYGLQCVAASTPPLAFLGWLTQFRDDDPSVLASEAARAAIVSPPLPTVEIPLQTALFRADAAVHFGNVDH